MHVKSFLSVAACAAALVGLSAAPAFAGEIKGPGSPTGIPVDSPDVEFTGARTHSNSICSFSGLNHYHAGVPGELPIRTQSYGQLVKAGFKAVIPSPGEACNGHLNPLK